VLAVPTLRLDVVLNVEIVHVIEPPTEATRWNYDVNVVRKVDLDPRCS
jgi:hypothetical protein